MHAVAPIDYLIMVAYFAITLLAGLIMTRRASSNMEEYFLGGRRMPWWLLGVAGMTSWFDMTGTMIITSFLYMLGPRGLYIEFRGGAVLVLAFMLCYAGKWHRRSGVMTGAEWMTYRFGTGRSAEAVRAISAVLGVICTLGLLAYLVRGTSLFMGMFFPWSPFWLTAGIVGITALYTMCSGFYGVVLADLIQGVIIIIACVLVGLIAFGKVTDVHALGALAQSVTGNAQWTSSAMSFHTTMPKGYEPYQMLFMFAMFYLVRNVLGGLGSGIDPRYFAARNDRECGLQSLLQGLTVSLRWPMMIGFAIMGLLLVQRFFPAIQTADQAAELVRQYHPDVAANAWHDLTSTISNHPQTQPVALIEGLRAALGDQWPERLQLVAFNGGINPERVLPAVLMYDIPAGLKGFILVAMFAAMMSTFTGTVNGSSALVVRDLYQNFLRPLASDRELITLSYLSTVLLVVGGFYLGMAADNINTIWGWFVMSFGAGGLAPGLLRLYWWRFNAWGVFGGLLLGCLGCTLQLIFAPGMVEWQQFLIMTSLSFIGSLAGTYLTAPTPMDRLRHFYATTRPFGWWGPVRDTLTPAQQQLTDRENRNDIIAVPFTLLWQVTIFLIPMQIVMHAWDSALKTLPLLIIGCAGMYWFWWRNLQTAAEGARTIPLPSAERHPLPTPEPALELAAK